ncbi:MAG: aminotransferase class V-fold PLP-dependent enzyme [Chitinivibrionales bacterium]|nr:aminotransferase class V-fold PLP-dependent enzyme [Chitinivibrionales bacterium]
MRGFTTRALHGAQGKPDAHGALRFPLYENVAYTFDSARSAQLVFEGRKPAHAYSRSSNPTVEHFEQVVKNLCDAMGVIAVSSGMAAVTNVVLTLAESGANIITSRNLFGNTVSLFERTFAPWGLSVKYVNMQQPDSLAALLDDKTRLIFVETITNPQIEVADLQAVSAIARERGVPLVIDNTLTTPYLCTTKSFGAAVEIMSSTKYISGGGTGIGGLIIDNGLFDWRNAPRLKAEVPRFGPATFLMKVRREVYRNTGACLSPNNAWLQTLGLETLSMRIDKSCASAQRIAEFLATHPHIARVRYPGLSSHPHHTIAMRQFGGKCGALLSFELASQEQCFAVIDQLKLITRATNLNDNRTLIIHPASTIFCEFTPEENEAMQVPGTLVRLAVGIEDTQDIIDDLSQALEQI